ncbi:MAG: nicotinamide riboside transporter PnuC [Candidatus Kapaibacterium sp.]|jgi:nicotinamide mononucleotide transporter
MLIEVLSGITGVVYVILLTAERRSCWLFGNLSVALLGYSCWEAGLYADMALQGVYFAIGVVGFLNWTPTVADRDKLHISRISLRTGMLMTIVCIVVWIVVYQALRLFPGSRLPMMDSLLFSCSLVATWFQARKYLENWLLWIPINIAYAGLYYSRDLPVYVGLSLVFAALSLRGLVQWRSVMRLDGRTTTP